jgi:hypothetical protein
MHCSAGGCLIKVVTLTLSAGKYHLLKKQKRFNQTFENRMSRKSKNQNLSSIK